MRSGGRYVIEQGAKPPRLVDGPTKDHRSGNRARDASGRALGLPAPAKEAPAPKPLRVARKGKASLKPTSKPSPGPRPA